MIISPEGYGTINPGFNPSPVALPRADQPNPDADQTSSFQPRAARTQTDQQTQGGQNNSPDAKTGDPSSATETPPTRQEYGNTVNGHVLTESEIRLLNELQQVDAEVRRHEMAHINAGGRYITSGANFTYKRGPDGKNYAVSGEVSIDTSPIPGDPEATVKKMRQIRNAALAPANPSAQDLKVASKASSLSSKALSEIMMLAAKARTQSNETSAFGNSQNAEKTYTSVSTEEIPPTFQISV